MNLRDITPREATFEEMVNYDQAVDEWEDYQVPDSKARKHHLVPEMFDEDQLAIGTTVELEHTDNPAVALEIAMIHLEESPLYYAALDLIEKITAEEEKDLSFAGYSFTAGPKGTKIHRDVIDTKKSGDYGADPLGDGMFRMVPSGDIVDWNERNRRLKR